MLRTLSVLSGLILCLLCVCCHREDVSPLAGTSWECREDGSILLFSDSHSGLYYCKSATDGVYDEIFSSFDFTYETSGNDISLRIQFSRRVYVIDGTIEENEMTTTHGHYVKIEHRRPMKE